MRFGCFLPRLAAVALAFAALCLPMRCTAQSFDLDRGREPVVSLNGLWRFHPGDSPRVNGTPLWAAPGFDDSAWPLLRSGTSWAAQGYPGMSGYAWYRFEVRVPAGEKSTSLLLAPILTAYQVYVDGKLVGQCGSMAPSVIPSTPISYHLFSLTTEESRSPRIVHVALRVWHSPIWAGYVGGGPFKPDHLAGAPDLLRAEQEHHQMVRDVRYVDSYSYSITAALIGLALLCLFFIRPGEREYLWFAVILLAQASDNALYVGHEIYFWPSMPVYDLADGILVALNIFATLCFFSRVLEVRTGKTGRIALVLAAFSAFAAVLYWPGWASAPASASIQIVCLLPAMVWVLYALIERAIRGNADARLLLIPTVLDLGFYFADNLAIVLDQIGLTHRPRIFEIPVPLPPFNVQTGTLLHLFFLLALLVFLIRRFALASQKEERLAGEFEAARQVQHVLLPDALDQCPGFKVECIYQPAEQVGGDFFQQITDSQCGMLIVIGDVSGKGLPAAMMVSVLVGAIRTEADHGCGPAALLSALNQRMLGRLQGGFTTCLAAHLSPDGLLTLANAGHLPPYLNGEELDVPGSLPLGLAEQAQYQTMTVQLQPGDELTFLSDGVVEAQSKSGELFGFERTRALSREPAARIAEAARSFGQIDDITVVTVEFAGAWAQAEASRA